MATGRLGRGRNESKAGRAAVPRRRRVPVLLAAACVALTGCPATPGPTAGRPAVADVPDRLAAVDVPDLPAQPDGESSAESPGSASSSLPAYQMRGSAGPSLVWTGERFGIAWQDDRDRGPDVYFAALDSTGEKLVADTRVSLGGARAGMPSLAWGGGEYGLAWCAVRAGEAEERFVRLDRSGAPAGGETLVSSHHGLCRVPALVRAEEGWAVAWTDDRPDEGGIFLARLDAAGAVTGEASRVAGAEGSVGDPKLIATRPGYAAAWHVLGDGFYDASLARFDPQGSRLGVASLVPGGPGPSRTASYPALARAVDGLAAAWVDTRDGNNEIYFARFAADGRQEGVDLRVTDHPGSSLWPALAAGAHGFGLAWRDERNREVGIVFLRVNGDDLRAGEEHVVAAGSRNDAAPVLVAGESGWGLAWTYDAYGFAEVHFLRLDDDGERLGDERRVSDHPGRPREPTR
jgi:hypothetical protein